MLKAFFKTDAQYTLGKGIWSYLLDWLFMPESHEAVPQDESTDVGALPKREPSFLFSRIKPMLRRRPKKKPGDETRYENGSFILLFTTGIPAIILDVADFILESLVETPATLYLLFRYRSTTNLLPTKLVALKQSSYLFITFKVIVGFATLIRPFKWLWRAAAITLPSLGLSLNRIAMLFGVFVALSCLIGAVVITGSTASPFFAALLFGKASVVLPVIANIWHSVAAAFTLAGSWMASNFFFMPAFMAVVIKWGLFMVTAAAYVATVGNVFSGLWYAVVDQTLQRTPAKGLYDAVEEANHKLDQALGSALDFEYKFKPSPDFVSQGITHMSQSFEETHVLASGLREVPSGLGKGAEGVGGPHLLLVDSGGDSLPGFERSLSDQLPTPSDSTSSFGEAADSTTHQSENNALTRRIFGAPNKMQKKTENETQMETQEEEPYRLDKFRVRRYSMSDAAGLRAEHNSNILRAKFNIHIGLEDKPQEEEDKHKKGLRFSRSYSAESLRRKLGG